MAMRIYLSIIILNVNELNIPIKRHKCQVGFFFFLTKDLQYTAYKRLTSGWKTHRLKVRGWKKIFYTHRNYKKAGVAILISDKRELKQRLWRKTKKGII